ncbi:hypothetical protein H0H81_007404 [Sphagnurus paluster]|uniref:Uncharacterized protein n=1 Tax=Sphagnurus paluster TaxID=117069 RepID=A0A9P7K1V2_9AGAR|nr:hypothetical protein H0H81_007404 [Sphagnurus paluster]
MASTSGNADVWSLPEVIEYFRSDKEIGDEISVEEFKEIINVQADWVKLVRTALEYQGFDPRVILSQLIRNRKSYEAQKPALSKWDLANVGDDLKWTSASEEKNKYTNMESIAKDVNFMITVFLARNNHIGKIIKKARGGVEDILNMLKEKAGFQSTAMPEKARKTIFLKLDLITIKKTAKNVEEAVLTDQSKALATSCYGLLGQIRTDDENHDLMMKVAKTGDMTLF